ncbi:hypothetical protein GUITHDRAFT_120828 [Guillardia theta CCMP2712]|uniref:Uncharacterized protein n=1 Tax=Guillardia theta (strain CCMP2712) TaxID=905079 RepID=L1IAX3_GUITC|nr:hypothetical protein GUITHDRAFT_120828 [Guillardia theta CCMP2712]EKX32995.1 hypothetical protein GUITHDRAFT_120828 [Guillardia theta CCMP2712]|eukprot:XP_005819975.1 hypothetical protein GUITHDRAFT_120828 [Guillardia theta CCMP2712]
MMAQRGTSALESLQRPQYYFREHDDCGKGKGGSNKDSLRDRTPLEDTRARNSSLSSRRPLTCRTSAPSSPPTKWNEWSTDDTDLFQGRRSRQRSRAPDRPLTLRVSTHDCPRRKSGGECGSSAALRLDAKTQQPSFPPGNDMLPELRDVPSGEVAKEHERACGGWFKIPDTKSIFASFDWPEHDMKVCDEVKIEAAAAV